MRIIKSIAMVIILCYNFFNNTNFIKGKRVCFIITKSYIAMN